MSTQSAPIAEHSSALFEKTTKILDILSTTPSAITELRSNITMQAEEQTKQRGILDRSLAAVAAHLNALTIRVANGSAMVRHEITFMKRASNTMFSVLQNLKKLFAL
ncbi:hypothetical protein RRF57_001435 [Xylaria bambusicola]|uniref:Uncharacterized protein n=1 Tax=Xylaria bambusicola TaxID=326684 RepID=A0AAN7UBH7_9PEZI